MHLKEFASALKKLIPSFQYTAGCYLVTGEYLDDVDDVRKAIDWNRNVLERRGKTKGVLKYTEREINHRFIIADFLDYILENTPFITENTYWSPENLLMVANIYASLLRDGLLSTFPDQDFEVEIIGDDGVDDEPLELCVTFSRKN